MTSLPLYTSICRILHLVDDYLHARWSGPGRKGMHGTVQAINEVTQLRHRLVRKYGT